jgi:hypothetical protein
MRTRRACTDDGTGLTGDGDSTCRTLTSCSGERCNSGQALGLQGGVIVSIVYGPDRSLADRARAEQIGTIFVLAVAIGRLRLV